MFYVIDPSPPTKFKTPFDFTMSSIESVMLFDDPMYKEICMRVFIKLNGVDIDLLPPYEPDENEKLYYFCIITMEHKGSKIIDTYNLDNIRQVRLPLHGYTQPAQFYSPQYPDGPQYYDVDYRRTLYWNPNLQTDKDGHARIEFYNNSYSTRFKASASGLNSGVPYSMDK